MDSFDPWQVRMLILTAVVAIFLSWLIARIAFRKSRRELKHHEKNNRIDMED